MGRKGMKPPSHDTGRPFFCGPIFTVIYGIIHDGPSSCVWCICPETLYHRSRGPFFVLRRQNTTGATSQGHLCTMFLLYQEKEGEGPGAPHSRPWPSRIQEQALTEGAIGPPVPPMGFHLSGLPQEAPHLVLAPPLL